MQFRPFTGLAMLMLLGSPIAARGSAQEEPPVTRGEATDRREIERILAADNLDTGRLSPGEVVATIRAIPRGRAPGDFWTAYQEHVRAWERFAAIEERVRDLGEGKEREAAIMALFEADREINTTFDEVERIARSYGAELPTPPAEFDARTI